MNRGRPRYLADITHIDQRRASVGFHQDSNRSFAEAVTECDALSHGDTRDTDVVRRFVGKIHRAANGERIIGGVESCYRGAICTLHQTSSVSSRWIIQPLASSGNHRRTLVDQNPGSKRAAITPSRFESGVTRSAIQL